MIQQNGALLSVGQQNLLAGTGLGLDIASLLFAPSSADGRAPFDQATFDQQSAAGEKRMQDYESAMLCDRNALREAYDDQQIAKAASADAERDRAGAVYRKAAATFAAAQTPKDATASLEEFMQAAARGNAQAQYAVGQMYLYGNGIPRDVVMGYAFTALAAKRRHPLAMKLAPQLRASLTPAQLRDAEASIAAFKPVA